MAAYGEITCCLPKKAGLFAAIPEKLQAIARWERIQARNTRLVSRPKHPGVQVGRKKGHGERVDLARRKGNSRIES